MSVEIKINVEELRKCKLFVATPCYGGMCHGLYLKSALDLQNTMNKYGIEVKFSFLFNESLIVRARNYLADEFMRSGFTHMLFIDSDIHFNAQDVLAMLALDKELTAAVYPKKTTNWKNIIEAVKRNPEIKPVELEQLVGEYVFNPVAGTASFNVTEPVEVMEAGTGFMLIKREVFDQLREAYPQIRYKPDHVGQEHFDGSRDIYAYFDTIIDSPDSILGNGSFRLLSEDYLMCQLYRKIGGRVFICPWIRLGHCGTQEFRGNLPAVAQFVGRL